MRLFVFLDYDGTLTPIVSTPEKAYLPRDMKELLRWLAGKESVKVAIISGRSLKDLKKKVGLKGIIYAGNHGLEIEDRGKILHVPISNEKSEAVKRVYIIAKKVFGNIKGALVENKGMTVSIHYRMVDAREHVFIKNQIYTLFGSYIRKKLIIIEKGKMVYDVKPVSKWNKGEAILWILKKYRFSKLGKAGLPIYIGDDKTDEYAFQALKGKGITIKVGKRGKTHAQSRLKDARAVKEYIKELANMDIR